MAQLKDLIVTGASRFLGNIYGTLKGNADTATKATQDSSGQQINTTYIKGLSVSGKTVTYTKGDGTTATITTQDTNTDTKVTQSETTSSNFRPILFGATNTTDTSALAASTTAQSYVSTKLYAKPSAGELYATTFKGNLSGNASTASSADKLTTARTIRLSGDVTGSTTFDGSGNKSISATLANSGVTAGSYGPSANASPAHGGTFSVPQVTVDAKGRVTGAASRTITMPAVTHPSISTSSDSTSSSSPGFGGSFTAIDSVTRDGNGHVTKVNTKTVSLPAAPTLSSLGGASTKLFTATIGTSWSGSAPYTQSITVSGMLASDTPIVDVDLSSIAYSNKNAVIDAYSNVYRIATAANSITVYSDKATSTAIPIQLRVVR